MLLTLTFHSHMLDERDFVLFLLKQISQIYSDDCN